MIEITPNISIDENEIQFNFIRASGPGGQNVNKVSSVVQLRFDIQNSRSLNQETKEKLIKLAGSRVNDEGILCIEAKRYRTQEQNRQDSIHRLITLIQSAIKKPKIRKPTRPSLSAKSSRLFAKKRRAEIKRTRYYNPDEWE